MGTKCDFRQNPIPHYDGCQQSLDARHIFQVLTKHFWFWKKHFLSIRNEKTGRFHKILAPNLYVRVFPNGDVLYRFFPSTSGFSDLWKTLLQYSGLPDGGLIIKMITIMRMTRWKNYNYNMIMNNNNNNAASVSPWWLPAPCIFSSSLLTSRLATSMLPAVRIFWINIFMSSDDFFHFTTHVINDDSSFVNM